MKSQVHVLFQVERALLADVQAAYPHLRGVDKDLVRLTSCTENRGLGFYTLDLPNLDAILLDGLEKGRLTLQGPCSTARSKKIRVPRLFSGLWLRVFRFDGVLMEEPDVTSIAFLRQLCCLGKKIEVPCSRNRVIDALSEYHGVERTLRHPTLQWECDILDPGSLLHSVHFCDALDDGNPLFPSNFDGRENSLRRSLGNLERICSMVSSALGTPDPYSLSEREGYESRGTVHGLRHGPGAVSDLKKGMSKYSFPYWPEKLQHYFPADAFAFLNASHLLESPYPPNHEMPSKLICVPKTAKAPRLIASEPTCYQWTQQFLASYVTQKYSEIFKGDFITIKDQEPSRRMVVAASLDRELCTIDLSSASDRLSCWFVERAFRGNVLLLELLHATRTRWSIDRISPETSWLKLKKFSTQGSALTFPIQSILFLCCALAVLPAERSLEDYRKKWRKSVRVFGDDIIIPTTGYEDMCDLLHYLGLKVNLNKSFKDGHFRESCGMDAYKGYDVTPSKPKTLIPDSPKACNAVIDYSNNLHKAGYWHAAAALASTLPRRVFQNLPIVGLALGSLGLASFSGSNVDHLATRWNESLQRSEVRSYAIMAKNRRKQTGGYDAIFQYLTEKPRPDTVWQHGVASESKVRDGLRWVDRSGYTV